jgi:hypothetical protein
VRLRFRGQILQVQRATEREGVECVYHLDVSEEVEEQPLPVLGPSEGFGSTEDQRLTLRA